MAQKPGNHANPGQAASPNPSPGGKTTLAPFLFGMLATALLGLLAVLGTMLWDGESSADPEPSAVGTTADEPGSTAKPEAEPEPAPEPVIIYKNRAAPLEARLEAIQGEFQEARNSLQEGDHDSALIKFRTAASLTRELLGSTNLEEHKSAVEALLINAHRAAGEILFETARYPKAIAEYSAALETAPESGFLLARRGQCYLALDEPEKAAADIETAVKRNGEDPVILTAAGQLRLTQAQSAENALQLLKSATGKDGTVAETWFWLGKALAQTGDQTGSLEAYHKAAEGFTQTLHKRPGALRWRSCRSTCYVKTGNFARAVGDLNIYLANFNTDAAAYANRGYSLLKLGRAREAIEDFYAALKLDPQMTSAYINRGDAFMRIGRTEQAIADYDRALELNPDNSVAWHNRGTAHRLANNLDLALEDLEKARELDPDSTMILHGIGSIYLRKGMFQRAVDLYDVILERDAADALAHSCRGAAHFAAGFYQDAVQDFTHSIAHDGAKAEVFGRRAVAYNMLGQPEEALKDLDEAIRLSPDDHRLYSLRGSIRHYLGDAEGSLADMRKAMELDSSNVAASEKGDQGLMEVAN